MNVVRKAMTQPPRCSMRSLTAKGSLSDCCCWVWFAPSSHFYWKCNKTKKKNRQLSQCRLSWSPQRLILVSQITEVWCQMDVERQNWWQTVSAALDIQTRPPWGQLTTSQCQTERPYADSNVKVHKLLSISFTFGLSSVIYIMLTYTLKRKYYRHRNTN